MNRVCLSLLLTMILPAGAASAQLYAVPIIVADAIYQFEGYSVLAPQGNDWFELKRDQHNVIFGKKIASRTHAFIATAMSTQIAEKFEKPEQFRAYVETTSLEPDDKRSQLVESRAELDPSIGPFCVRLYVKALDRGAANAKGHSLVLETFGVSCLHPADASLAVSVSFSERGQLAETSAELRAQGEGFVGSLKFTAIRP